MSNIVAFNADELTAERIGQRIRERWQSQVPAILDVGYLLIEAREQAKHGTWQWLFSPQNPEPIPFGERTARMLMAICKCELLTKRKHASVLPPVWMTLYYLSKVPDDDLARAFEQGLIHPEMERKDAKALLYGHGGEGDGLGDEWYTPKWLFDALGVVFSIDVCGPADRTYVSVPCEQYYTEADDGLLSPWDGTVWCNPPYSDPAPWAKRSIQHDDGLLLTHIPMNAEWASAVWQACSAIRLFQAIEFVRPDGKRQRPGMWLQLAAFGDTATEALAAMQVPDDVAENPRRVPSPLWVKV